MKEYRITHWEKLEGDFYVEAESEDDALDKFYDQVNDGKIDFSDLEMVDSEDTAECVDVDCSNISVSAWADRVEYICPNGVLGVDYNLEKLGSGRLEMIFDENGKAHMLTDDICDCNDKEFAKAVLNKLIDDAIVED